MLKWHYSIFLYKSSICILETKYGWSNVAKFNEIISCVQRNNYFDSTKYLYIQRNNYFDSTSYLYIQWNNYFDSTKCLYIQRNNYFYLTNYLHVQRKNYFHSTNCINLFNEWIEVFLFNQTVKYMFNEI